MLKKYFVALALLVFPISLHAQAVSPVTSRLAHFNVGGFFSVGQTDYGQYHSVGPGAYADFNYRIWRNVGIGAEGEARFLNFRKKSGVYEQNFLGGPRVTYELGRRWLPYGKFLVGGSRFHYPTFISNQVYTYTTYSYGGGIDYRYSKRITIRAADFERQHWNFPPTGLTPWAFSVGASYEFF